MDRGFLFDYDGLVDAALRGVVRNAIEQAVTYGLPGEHHFYVTFRTQAPGVKIPPHLLATHPEEITIVLQHEYWNLALDEDAEDSFSVTLSFNDRKERVVVPFSAVTGFADPSAKFGLQLQYESDVEDSLADEPAPAEAVPPPFVRQTPEVRKPAPFPADTSEGKVVALDAFRKK